MARVLGAPEDHALAFLTDRVVLYYAGLDDVSLPFGEARRQLATTAAAQPLYLKALLLVADFVVVPPSFLFAWSAYCQGSVGPQDIARLHQAQILLSPVYRGMTSGLDFLDYKLGTGSRDETAFIRAAWDSLQPLFDALPVFNRDVGLQSGGFHRGVSEEVEHLNIPVRARDSLQAVLGVAPDALVRTSRTDLHQEAQALEARGILSRRQFRGVFHAINRAYYHQGARTYGAAIAVPAAPRYAVLGSRMFQPDGGIVVAYDPEVILALLAGFGIEREEVQGLPLQNLLRLRESRNWRDFTAAYSRMAFAVQGLQFHSGRLSNADVEHLKAVFLGSCLKTSSDQQARYRRLLERYSKGEVVVTSLGLGGLGLALTPIAGFFLGLLPVVLYFSGVTAGLGKRFADKIEAESTAFFRFVNDLQQVADRARLLPSAPPTGVA